MQCLFLKGKLKTKQNLSLSGSGYWVYRRTRWPRVGATRGGRPQLGLKARHDTGHWTKRGGAAPFQILDVDLFCEFLLTLNSYGPESGGVGKVMKFSFQPCKVLLKRSPYVAMALFLVQTVSGIREGNEVQVVDESDFNVYASDATMSSSIL